MAGARFTDKDFESLFSKLDHLFNSLENKESEKIEMQSHVQEMIEQIIELNLP